MKKKLAIFSPDKVTIISRAVAEVGPHSDIAVPSSPEHNLNHPGTKCEHGVYIPATSVRPNHAPYCSLCYPYVLELKS